MADRSNDPFEPNPSSIRSTIQADLAKLGNRLDQSSHYYELMLESCEKLFDNEIEQGAFEDQMRLMFGIKVRFLSIADTFAVSEMNATLRMPIKFSPSTS